MRYCGIDVAGVSSYMYVTDEEGRKLISGEVATEKQALTRRLKPYVKGGLKVALEAGNQTGCIQRTLVETRPFEASAAGTDSSNFWKTPENLDTAHLMEGV